MRFPILSFLVAALTFSCRSKCKCSNDIRHVQITFESTVSSSIDSVHVYAGNSTPGRAGIAAAYSKNLCVCFESPGENSFSVSAALSDGTVLTSREEYSEGGYRFRAIVKADGIILQNERAY